MNSKHIIWIFSPFCCSSIDIYEILSRTCGVDGRTIMLYSHTQWLIKFQRWFCVWVYKRPSTNHGMVNIGSMSGGNLDTFQYWNEDKLCIDLTIAKKRTQISNQYNGESDCSTVRMRLRYKMREAEAKLVEVEHFD